VSDPTREAIERAATVSIGRATGFAGLAVLVAMAGLAGWPLLALRTGAAGCLLAWAILRLKALAAPRRPYRHTELWLILEPKPRLPAPVLQLLIGAALDRGYRRAARLALGAALLLWLASLALRLLAPG
jgi:hypothetical protein